MKIFQTGAFYQNGSLFTENKFSQQKLMMFMQLALKIEKPVLNVAVKINFRSTVFHLLKN